MTAGKMLFGAAFCLSSAWGGESPAATQKSTPEEGIRIQKLIRQLGAEQFEKREAAQRELLTFGARALRALEAAQSTDDPEVLLRIAILLPAIRAEASQAPWLKSIRTAWPKALREGRLCGPLLGAEELGPLWRGEGRTGGLPSGFQKRPHQKRQDAQFPRRSVQ